MNNIQIFELRLKDYRQYRGEVVIDLETEPGKHINVIEGQNGSGKSNILNAITLCFYGSETHTESQNDSGLESEPLVNKKRLNELEPGESTEGFVEIKLGKEEPEYAFRRTFTTVRRGEASAEPKYSGSIGDLKLRQRFGGHDWRPISQPTNILREILPTHVHQYFLFDGEQLHEFFEEGYTDRVKNAVLDVSHVELLNSAVDHLDVVRKGYESKSSDLGGDIAELQERKEKAEQELERLKQKKSTLEDNVDEAKGTIEGINEELSGSADEEVREMQNRREYLEGKLDEKESGLKDAKKEVASSLTKAGAIAYNADALNYAITALEEYESSNDSITGLDDELLESVLTRGECICGADLSTDETAREHLEDLLHEDEKGDHKHIKGRLQMKQALEEGEDLIDELLADKGQVEDIRTWIEDKESELGRISNLLEQEDTIDNARASELEKQRKRVSERVDKMNRELGELDGEIKQQNQVIEARHKEWQKATREKKENEVLVEKSEFVENASTTLEEIKHDILHQVRTETESRLQRYYNDLIWKNEDYEVTLTSEYEVKLYNQDGRKNLGSLSAGERQVLALAFMASLSKISGFSAPIVIDTPLGRISSDPKKLIAQNVPEYLKDTQVTFLMTDVEYSDDVRAFISDSVTNEYHLEYKDGVTEVI